MNHPITILKLFPAGMGWLLAVFLSGAGFSGKVWAQCSDAGLCTAPGWDHSNGPIPGNSDSTQWEGDARNEPASAKRKIHHSIGQDWGLGERNSFQGNTRIGMRLAAHDRVLFQSALNFRTAYGDLGLATGFGELNVSANYQLTGKKQGPQIWIGTRLPLHRARVKKNGNDLPLAYQPGMGTWDVMGGWQWPMGSWSIGSGAVMSLTRSPNQFLPENWPEGHAAGFYAPSRELDRAPDLMVRVGKNWIFSKERSGQVLIMPLWHIREDRILDGQGQIQDVAGSKGITVNAMAILKGNYGSIPYKWSLGAPIFLNRTVRPDGLTRSVNISLELGF